MHRIKYSLHFEGEITIDEAKHRIDSYYQSRTARNEVTEERTEEADKVAARIAELLGEQTFTLAPTELVRIHRHLFTGIYKHAGQIRDYNITQKELAVRTGKSERTIKRMTVALAGRGIMARRNGKRNGYWEIL